MPGDAPAVAVTLQHQVDQAHMAAPEPGHHRGLALQRGFFVVDALALEITAGEGAVGVAGDDRVDPVDPGQVQRGVFHHRGLGSGVDAGMRQCDDDLGAGSAQGGHMGASGLKDVAGGEALQMCAVPLHHLRRHKADDADADGVLFARTIGQLTVKDDPGLEVEVIGVGRVAKAAGEIGADNGECGAGVHQIKERQAIVEFMVAKGAAIIADRVHARDHRVDVAFVHPLGIGDVIGHRVALHVVAIVQRQGVRSLGPGGHDVAGGAGKAQRVAGFVGVVVIGLDVAVQVGGGENAQMRLAALGAGGEGVQKRDAGGSGGQQERPAGQGEHWTGHGREPPLRYVASDGPDQGSG